MNNVLSISGGKDSTAMLLKMRERGESIHSAVWFDTGWEFPEMERHISKLEKYTGIKIWILHPTLPFDYWLYARPVIAGQGLKKGIIHRVGQGWPSPMIRWCTRLKIEAIDKYCKPIPDVVQCIGYASDETKRKLSKPLFKYRFPLQEYGITEKEALQICYQYGFNWGGLYEYFDRVSCFCCPLQRISELRKIRMHYPKLWQRMLEMDDAIPVNRGFMKYKTVRDLDRRFENEETQQKFAWCA